MCNAPQVGQRAVVDASSRMAVETVQDGCREDQVMKSTRFRSGALSLWTCSARSTTRSMFYLVLPAPTLTAGFPDLRCLARTTLGFRPPPDYGSGGGSLMASAGERGSPASADRAWVGA
jgi:hypothetical protein